jgi:hypothetical protein
MAAMASSKTEDTAKEETPLINSNDDVVQSTPSFLQRVCSSITSEDAIFMSSARSISSLLTNELNSTERKDALENTGIGPAAHLIRDAVLGESDGISETWGYDPHAHPDQPVKNFVCVLCARLVAYHWMVRFLLATAWTLALVTFLEPPQWCRDSDLEIAQGGVDHKFGTCGVILDSTGTAVDGEENVQYYPNSSSMFLTLEQSRTVEWVCLFILTSFLILRLGRDGFEFHRFFHSGYNRLVHCLRCLLLVCLYTALITKNPRFSPFLRLVMLGTYLPKFQKELLLLIKMVRALP